MEDTERLIVELPSDLVTALRNAMREGDFASEGEVIEAILLAWRHANGEVEEPDIETLRAFVAEGIAASDAGHVSAADDVYARVRARIEAAAASKAK